MTVSKRELSQLIGHIYAGVSDPIHWQSFLEQFCRLVSAERAAILMHDFQNRGHSLESQHGFDPDEVRNYYVERRDVTDLWATRARLQPVIPKIGFSQELCTDQELLRSDYYNEILRQFDIFFGLFGVIRKTGSQVANVSIYRPKKMKTFAQNEAELLDLVLPHLCSAVTLRDNFSQLDLRARSLEAALDLILLGVVFLLPDGKIVFANRKATEILQQKRGLKCIYGCLRAEQSRESARLEQIIKQTAEAANGVSSGNIMDITNKGLLSLRVLIAPHLSNIAKNIQKSEVIGFILDPTQSVPTPIHVMLGQIFDLTKAESRIAVMLADGLSLADISEELGVTRNTLKTQLSNIYGKTGLHRQAQLVRLLLQLSSVRL
jgi:DNA-binding CsgD family transcriptional regulator/PAS domain-containing protein